MEAQMFKDGHLGGYIHGGDEATWCPNLWKWIVQSRGIKSVLDIGCGEGHSTKFFRDLGLDVLGVEGCQKAIDDSVVPENVVKHDFREGPFLPDRDFDMVWSCEFVEHVDERFVANILKTFFHAKRLVLMTHAVPGEDYGHHHVNCRHSSYWIGHLEKLGFDWRFGLTRQARITTLDDFWHINHFARSGLVFLRDSRRSGKATPAWQARLMTAWLRQSFKLSGAYRTHRRQRRIHKRRLRQQRLDAADGPMPGGTHRHLDRTRHVRT